MKNRKIIKISQEKWNEIPADYKGIWEGYHNDHPEWIGKRIVMSTIITNKSNELCKLWIEGIHFIIVEK